MSAPVHEDEIRNFCQVWDSRCTKVRSCLYLARPESCNFPVKGFFADTKLENNRYNYIRWYYIHIAKSPPGSKRAWSRRHKGIREVR